MLLQNSNHLCVGVSVTKKSLVPEDIRFQSNVKPINLCCINFSDTHDYDLNQFLNGNWTEPKSFPNHSVNIYAGEEGSSLGNCWWLVVRYSKQKCKKCIMKISIMPPLGGRNLYENFTCLEPQEASRGVTPHDIRKLRIILNLWRWSFKCHWSNGS